MTKEGFKKLLATELFHDLGGTANGDLSSARLTGTDFWMIHVYPEVFWLTAEDNSYTNIEEILESVSEEIAERLIFHMDLLV